LITAVGDSEARDGDVSSEQDKELVAVPAIEREERGTGAANTETFVDADDAIRETDGADHVGSKLDDVVFEAGSVGNGLAQGARAVVVGVGDEEGGGTDLERPNFAAVASRGVGNGGVIVGTGAPSLIGEEAKAFSLVDGRAAGQGSEVIGCCPIQGGYIEEWVNGAIGEAGLIADGAPTAAAIDGANEVVTARNEGTGTVPRTAGSVIRVPSDDGVLNGAGAAIIYSTTTIWVWAIGNVTGKRAGSNRRAAANGNAATAEAAFIRIKTRIDEGGGAGRGVDAPAFKASAIGHDGAVDQRERSGGVDGAGEAAEHRHRSVSREDAVGGKEAPTGESGDRTPAAAEKGCVVDDNGIVEGEGAAAEENATAVEVGSAESHGQAGEADVGIGNGADTVAVVAAKGEDCGAGTLNGDVVSNEQFGRGQSDGAGDDVGKDDGVTAAERAVVRDGLA